MLSAMGIIWITQLGTAFLAFKATEESLNGHCDSLRDSRYFALSYLDEKPIRKHEGVFMQIRNLITLVLFLASTTTFAVDNAQTYPSKDECLRQFYFSSGTSDAVAGEKFCKDKFVKTPADVCADKKLLDFKMKNSISSVEEPLYAQKFKKECALTVQSATPSTSQQSSLAAQQSGLTAQQQSMVSQQQAQIAAQQAAVVAQQKAAAAAAEAKKNQGTAQQQQQQNADILKTIAPLADKVAGSYDAASKAAGKTDAKAADAAKPADPATTAAGQAAPAPASEQPEQLSGPGFVQKEAPAPTPDPSQPVQLGGPVDPEVAAAPAAALEAKAGTDGASEALKRDVPAVTPQVNAANDSTNTPSDAAAPPTETTSASEALTAASSAEIKQNSSSTSQQLQQKVALAYTGTIAAMQEFDAKWEAFTALKKTCTKLSETSGFLCIEGSSPGAQAAKTLVDASGPILGAISSAQKACSNTASVTDMAGKVMAIAKGTCVAAKLACDGGCAMANTNLTALKAMVTAMSGKVSSDQWTAAGNCASLYCDSPYTQTMCTQCTTENTTKQATAQGAIQKYKATLEKETPPATAGTASYAGAKCASNMKDIVSLGLNVAQLAMAKKSAAECDKKLAASGAGGAAVATTQYCETPANVTTQFCKCQKNSQQAGCPGFSESAAITNKDKTTDIGGINLKTGAGLSGFAGGTNGSLDPSKGAMNGKNANGSNSSSDLTLSNADGSAANAGGGGGSGGGGSSGGGFASGSNSKDELGEQKKWSFGSFANALGGMFGSGSKGSKNSGNGNASAKQQAAIQRKLASDKLAGEITSASGKSNWEKVRKLYLIKENTLLSGQ